MTRGRSTVDGIEVTARDELEDVGLLSDITQLVAFDTDSALVLEARLAGDTVTDWHHHGDHHAFDYVMEGHVVLEFGPDGRETLDAYAGDFIHVLPKQIHRTRNPSDEGAVLLAALFGSGPPVVDVEGPGTT